MKGRGTRENPQVRFETLAREAFDDEWNSGEDERQIPTQYFRDASKTILSKNESPDLGFTYGLNPVPRMRTWLHLLLRPSDA